nr:MAG TPA: hypothetical protein [Bacteriophage sp.]
MRMRITMPRTRIRISVRVSYSGKKILYYGSWPGRVPQSNP